MRKSQELKADIDDLRNEVQAVIRKCESENRDLLPAEQKRIDEILNDGGLVAKLEASLKTAVQVEANSQQKIRDTLGPKLQQHLRDNGVTEPPAAMRDRSGNLVYALDRTQRVQDIHPACCPNALGELIKAMAVGSSRHAPEAIRAFMTSGNNAAGGFLVPGELSSEIIDLARAKSVIFRLGARTVPMSTSELAFAKVASDPTIEVKAENAAFTEQEISFSGINLSAHTFGCIVTASRELAEDAPNFPELVSQTISRALATQLDFFTIQGTGAGQPTGLINDPDIDDTGTTSVGGLEYTDLAAAAEAVRVRNHEPSGIILHPSSHSDVLLSTAGDGTNSERIWLTRAPTLANANFLDTTNCPLANGIVGDFTKLIWGIRTAAQVEADTSGTRFDKHQVGFKITFRGDFGITDPAAFHLLSGITS